MFKVPWGKTMVEKSLKAKKYLSVSMTLAVVSVVLTISNVALIMFPLAFLSGVFFTVFLVANGESDHINQPSNQNQLERRVNSE